ncbi:MAG: PP2C family protein-serine/threonine phosphatase [Acidimicrobiales bacterium]
MESTILVVVAVAAFLAAVVWGRSASHRARVLQRVRRNSVDPDARELARSDYRKDLHTAGLYGTISLAAAVAAVFDGTSAAVFVVVLAPAVVTFVLGQRFVTDAKLAQYRLELERRAQEVIDQEDSAPRRWAARLAPDELPDVTGFEVGRVYQAGTGLMAGDFYDVFRVAPTRVAAVIGDVTGHGIEPSITAFQAKYLLRTFLRQFRDPAQALEELNTQMSAMDRGEEFISLCVVVFDTEAGTLRFASAGHPPAWLWHEREVSPLRSTGPLLMLDPQGTYYSREIPLLEGDMALLYTDGLAEARSGDTLFGEDRIATIMRRDPGAAPDVLCKTLLEAARDFSEGPIEDDVAILAVRRS